MPSIFTTDSIVSQQQKSGGKYAVYTTRWFILLAVILLNFSYGFLCTSLTPLRPAAQAAICNGDEEEGCINFQLWLWIGFPIGFILTSPLITFLIVRTGILPAIYIAIVFSLIGVSIRFIAFSIESLTTSRYLLVLCAHGIHSFAHPIGLLLPPVISQQWFPSGQRTLATSLGILGYFVGYLTSFVLSPNVVDTTDTLRDLKNLTYICFAFAVLPLFPVLSIWENRPQLPPSASADDPLVARRCAVPRLFNSAMCLHCIVFAFCAGAVKFTFELHNQITCQHLHLFGFAGVYALSLIVAAALGAVLIAGITDTTYAHKKVYRTCLALTTISSCVLSWANSTDSHAVFVFISLLAIGFFGVALIAVGVELSVESMFAQHPAKPTALLFASCAFGELVYTLVAMFGQRGLSRNQLPTPGRRCKLRGSLEDFSVVQIVVSLSLLVFFLLAFVFLRWKPKRNALEKNESISDVFHKNPLGGDLRTRC
ncbi:MFS domain-containing protein [Aphelenchoides fujianensis]|nr:MFS domain-containing protein [Aphelenchoides fujianensis]